MAPEDKQEFVLAVGTMLEAYGREVTKGALQGYWLGLQDMDLQLLKATMARVMCECEHCPPPVTIRRLAGEKSIEAQALSAWDDSVRAVEKLGQYKHVDFDDRFINATIRNLGGWPTFIGRFENAEAEKWLRLEFIKAYQSFAESRVDGEICEPLAGLATGEFLLRRCGDKLEEFLGIPEPHVVKCTTPAKSVQRRIGTASQKRLASQGVNAIGDIL